MYHKSFYDYIVHLFKLNFLTCVAVIQKGPVEQDVFSRMLVVKNPKTYDIIRESGFYFFNTTRRRFTGDVLGYITPVNFLFFMVHIYVYYL